MSRTPTNRQTHVTKRKRLLAHVREGQDSTSGRDSPVNTVVGTQGTVEFSLDAQSIEYNGACTLTKGALPFPSPPGG